MTKPKLRFKDKNGNAYPEWTIKRLIDLTDVRDGTHDSPKYVPFGYPLITSKNLNDNGKLNFSDVSFITKEDYEQINKRSDVSIGDILFGMIGTIGNPVMVSRDDFAIKNVALIKNNDNNFNRYLIYYLKTNSIQKQFYKEQAGGTQKFIALGLIRGLNINYPCIEEQEKIAGFLSKVDELINECEGEVKDLEEQKKGLMQKIFSQQIRFKDSNNNPYPDWEEHCINEFIISLKSGLSRELQNEDIGIPVIRANNTYNGIVGGNDIKYWYKKDPKGANIDNYVLDDGDILINFINSLPRMGEAAIFTNFLNRPCIYTTNLLRLKLNNKLNYKYFFYYTKTSEYINYIKAITKPAVNQASFTTVDFKNLKLLLPCQEEQEKIAKVLSKMDELIEEKKALLSDWQQFKKGLLQQMFV